MVEQLTDIKKALQPKSSIQPLLDIYNNLYAFDKKLQDYTEAKC